MHDPAAETGGGAEVPSPCVRLCRLHARTGVCEGCLRSLEEIAAWPSLDAAGRRAVLARVAGRRAAAGEPVRTGAGPDDASLRC